DGGLGVEQGGAVDRRAAGLLVAEEAGLSEQGLGRDVQGPGDRLQDPDRRLVQAALDLAEVGVGDVGQVRQLAEGEIRQSPLTANEGPQPLQLIPPGILTWHSPWLRERAWLRPHQTRWRRWPRADGQRTG